MMTFSSKRLLYACTLSLFSFFSLFGSACGDDDGAFKLGANAQLYVTPTSLVFSDTPVGQSARLSVEFRHVGSSGKIVLDPIKLETDSPDLKIGVIEGTVLHPNETLRIQIEYTPTQDAPSEGELVVRHNLINNPETRIAIRAPGRRARLIANPAELNFGVTQAARPKDLDLKIYNLGTAPTTITDYEVEGFDARDFSVILPEDREVKTGEALVVTVRYSPTGKNRDSATLTFKTDREDVSLEVPVEGEEETPILLVEPSLVQMGWTIPGEVGAREVTVKNDGNKTLTVTDIKLLNAHPELSLAQLPRLPFDLAPGTGTQFGVVFMPSTRIPMSEDPLAVIQFSSNDDARDPYKVPVFGAAGEPSIVVIPSEVVDFAFVAQGYKAERRVVVMNQGSDPVDITDLALIEPSTEEFELANEEGLPIRLHAGESVEIKLTFENRGGVSGTEYARFYIYTDDPVVPVYPLDVVAKRAQRPTCEAAFVPEILVMGGVPEGSEKEGVIRLLNSGSGECEYLDFQFDGCRSTPYGAGVRFICDGRGVRNPFEITQSPYPNATIGPGGEALFDVTFKAPLVESEIGRQSYYARLKVDLYDPNTESYKEISPRGGVNRGVSVRAESALSQVDVDPPELNFGLVRTDCESDSRQVRVRNLGPLEVNVTGLTPIGCGDDVLLGGPELPYALSGFASQFWNVTYAPEVEADMECVVRVETDAHNMPFFDVTVKGRGTDTSHHRDVFTQLPSPKVDLLFIIDDSFSMVSYQNALAEELPRLLNLATSWSQDYHIGITTTDTVLIKGNFKGHPRFADTSTDIEAYAHNMRVGTAGHFVERGLESAYMALYDRSERTGQACREDLPSQCPLDDGDGIPLICIEGECSGRNYGFLRDDAELIVVIVSDEEDGSRETVGYYIRKFAELKPPNSGYGIRVHSVVTPPEGCFGPSTPGLRYLQVTEALGGTAVSICAPDFAAQLNTVAEKSFGLEDRFYPTFTPEPGSLSVSVEGQECQSGWDYNSLVGAVTVDETGACYPQFEEEIALEYDVMCHRPRR